MRALVIGGAGMIGSWVAHQLLETAHAVSIFDNLEPDTHGPDGGRWHDPELRERYLLMIGDICDADTLEEAIRAFEPDTVFHLAAYGGFNPSPRKTIDTIIGGTLNVIDAVKDSSVETLVFASSGSVYGNGRIVCEDHGDQYAPPRSVLDLENGRWENRCSLCGKFAVQAISFEEHHCSPGSVYGQSKLAAERFVMKLLPEWNVKPIALRYSLTYGPWQSLVNDYTGICSIFARELTEWGTATVHEDGGQLRDFLYVEDAARATVAAADAPAGVYNCCSGRSFPVRMLVKLLAPMLGIQHSDWKMEMEGTWRADDVRNVMMSPTLLERTLNLPQDGLAPTVIDQGIRRYVEWFQKEGSWQLTM